MKDRITFRGDRNTWIDFVHMLKKERKQVWDVLGGMISEYLKRPAEHDDNAEEHTRSTTPHQDARLVTALRFSPP